MKIKTSKQEYKKHHFPVYLLFYFIILCLVAVVLLDILANVIVNCGLSGFLDKLAGIVVMLFAGGGLLFVEGLLVLHPKLKKDKIYRGIGFMHFLTVCSILCPIMFISFIIFLNIADITYIFFNIVTLFVEFAIPFVLSIVLKESIKYSIRFCPDCGLINTYVITDSKTVDLGTKHKFHNEGGYRHTWKTSDGVFFQDVPTTAVYDGEFQKSATTITYKCSVCGNIKTDYKTSENRVD